MKQSLRVLVFTAALAAVVLSACSKKQEAASGNTENETASEAKVKWRVAQVTDSGDITDQSFNQSTYEACMAFCKEHNMDFTYKKPDGDTDDARIAMIDLAVAEGYNVIVLPGFMFGPAVVATSSKYPDVQFIALDMTAGDIIAAAVGDKYWADPSAYKPEDYYNTKNTYCCVYREEIPGYMAGYAAVKMGYRKLGFLGGMAVPAVIRYGFGYVQGIDAAAKELGVEKDVTVEYAYSGQFYGSTEITAAMDAWCAGGTEVIFACGGGVFTSAAEAMAKVKGHIIGVDTDQAPVIDKYGEGMTVTSAMKGLGATIRMALTAIEDGTWSGYVGRIDNLGMAEGGGDNPDLNFVGLPEGTTKWNDGFAVEDYRALVKKIASGEITVSASTDAMPQTAVKVNERRGSIM